MVNHLYGCSFDQEYKWFQMEQRDVRCLLCFQEAQRRAKAERAGKAAHKPGGETSHGSKEQKQPASKAQGSKPGGQGMLGSEELQQQKTQGKMTKSRSLVRKARLEELACSRMSLKGCSVKCPWCIGETQTPWGAVVPECSKGTCIRTMNIVLQCTRHYDFTMALSYMLLQQFQW